MTELHTWKLWCPHRWQVLPFHILVLQIQGVITPALMHIEHPGLSQCLLYRSFHSLFSEKYTETDHISVLILILELGKQKWDDLKTTVIWFTFNYIKWFMPYQFFAVPLAIFPIFLVILVCVHCLLPMGHKHLTTTLTYTHTQVAVIPQMIPIRRHQALW